MQFTEEELKKLADKGKFLVSTSLYEDLKEMGEKETQLLFYSIFEYVVAGALPSMEGNQYRYVRGAFNRWRVEYTKDSRKWLDTCKKKSERKTEDWKKRQAKTT